MRKTSILFLILILFSLISCQSKISFTLQKNGSVKIEYESNFDEKLKEMIFDNSSDYLLDIKNGLEQNLFSDVQVEITKTKIHIEATDENCSSFFFTSSLLKKEQNKLFLNLNKENLIKFYHYSDEQIKSILDLFVASIFNDENMSVNEYIEMLSTFYGKQIAKEIENTTILLTTKDNSSSSEKLVSLPKVLCGEF